MLKTTLNINCDVITRITCASRKLNKSKRDIIVILLKCIMRDIDKFQGGFTTVKYQPDDEKGHWHCFSIRFKCDENEFWVDLRKMSKFSVSYLVAIAVDIYLDDLVKNSVHNYAKFNKYILVKETVQGIVCWQCYWGKLEKLENKKNKNVTIIKRC